MPNDPIIQVYRLWSPQHKYYLKLRIGSEEKILIEYSTVNSTLICLNTYDMENIERFKYYQYIKEDDYCNIQTDNSFQFKNDQKLLIIEEKHGLQKTKLLHFLIIGMLFFKKGQKMIMDDKNINEFLLDIENKLMVSKKLLNICKDINLNILQNDQLIQPDPSKLDGERLTFQSDPSDFDWEKFKKLHEIEYPPLKQYQELKQQKNQDRYELVQWHEQTLMKDNNYGFQLQDYENICILKKGRFQNEHFQGEIIEYDKQKNEIVHYINITIDKTGEKSGKNVRICYLSLHGNPVIFRKKRSYSGGFSNGNQNGNGIMIEYDNQGKQGQFYYSGKWENGFLNGFGIFQNFNKDEKIEYRKYIGEFKNTQFHGQGIALLYITGYTVTKGMFKNGKMVGNHQITTANQTFSKYYCC